MTDPYTPVREIMSLGAVSVAETLTLRSLAAVLTELNIGVALVERPDGSVGVVSERDIVDALAAGADPDEVWAADVTSPDLVCAEPEERIVDVAARMTAEGIRHMTVIDRGMIVGLVSVRDVLAVLSDAIVHST